MKAFLVIDMPNNCDECPLNSHTEYDFDVCWVTQGKGGCPLKSIPKTKERIDGEQFREWECEDHYKNGYANGWNDCLEEIQK